MNLQNISVSFRVHVNLQVFDFKREENKVQIIMRYIDTSYKQTN